MNMNQPSIIPYVIQPNDVLWKIAGKYNTTIYAIAVLNPGLDINHLRIGETIFVWPGLGVNGQSLIPKTESDLFTRSETELNKLMRMLWQQHINWTRIVMMHIFYDIPGTKQAIDRLYRTARDLEQTLRRYYPEAISAKFSLLLDKQINTVITMFTAAKENNVTAVKESKNELKRLADEFSRYFANLNSYWNKEVWQERTYGYVELLELMIVDTLAQRFQASINEFNEAEIGAYAMADYMTNGIIVHFRSHFK